eukprot:1187202-Prorocentrum_minimum.AAC.3
MHSTPRRPLLASFLKKTNCVGLTKVGSTYIGLRIFERVVLFLKLVTHLVGYLSSEYLCLCSRPTKPSEGTSLGLSSDGRVAIERQRLLQSYETAFVRLQLCKARHPPGIAPRRRQPRRRPGGSLPGTPCDRKRLRRGRGGVPRCPTGVPPPPRAPPPPPTPPPAPPPAPPAGRWTWPPARREPSGPPGDRSAPPASRAPSAAARSPPDTPPARCGDGNVTPARRGQPARAAVSCLYAPFGRRKALKGKNLPEAGLFQHGVLLLPRIQHSRRNCFRIVKVNTTGCLKASATRVVCHNCRWSQGSLIACTNRESRIRRPCVRSLEGYSVLENTLLKGRIYFTKPTRRSLWLVPATTRGGTRSARLHLARGWYMRLALPPTCPQDRTPPARCPPPPAADSAADWAGRRTPAASWRN